MGSSSIPRHPRPPLRLHSDPHHCQGKEELEDRKKKEKKKERKEEEEGRRKRSSVEFTMESVRSESPYLIHSDSHSCV